MSKTREKPIIAFCCENSSLRAAEAAEDPAIVEAVELVPMPCTGKIEIRQLLSCFIHGYQAVLVLGCPIDNCQYIKGNVRARKRVQMAEKALKDAGYDSNLIKMDYVSSVDTRKFIDVVQHMMNYIDTTVTEG